MIFTLKTTTLNVKNPDFEREKRHQFKNFFELYQKLTRMIDESEAYNFKDEKLYLKRNHSIVTCEISNIYKKLPITFILESYSNKS